MEGIERCYWHIKFFGTLTSTLLVQSCRTTALAKCLHRYSHAPVNEIINFLTSAGYPETTVAAVSKEIVSNCIVCSKSVLLDISRKVSLTHVKEMFSNETRCDFMFADIRSTV